jgi:hypothetical protein
MRNKQEKMVADRFGNGWLGIIAPDLSPNFPVRRFLCIFLLMLLPLQSFAVQGGWFAPGGAYDIAHELEHLEGTSHHHDDDGSIHYDDSGESDKHFAEHSASSQYTAALPSLSDPFLALDIISLVHSESSQYIPDPVPERPQRPPQTLG